MTIEKHLPLQITHYSRSQVCTSTPSKHLGPGARQMHIPTPSKELYPKGLLWPFPELQRGKSLINTNRARGLKYLQQHCADLRGAVSQLSGGGSLFSTSAPDDSALKNNHGVDACCTTMWEPRGERARGKMVGYPAPRN